MEFPGRGNVMESEPGQWFQASEAGEISNRFRRYNTQSRWSGNGLV